MTISPSDGLLLESALAYARLGYAVFPCMPGGKTPATKHGCKDATTDEARIAAWWRKQPNANIGLATTGLIVVDVDGDDNPWLKDQPDLQQTLALAPLSLTPSGGRHHIFRQPNDRAWGNTTGRLAPKVDTRGDGG
ncbi:MAG TPA: bifunctional DNA primase/polymerase, partial [Vicinamibacterales bacterium]|nr:bifunctional DNA primase/polymerase [Vicinamibacterales bacterium]